MVHTGQHGEFDWLVSTDQTWDLAEIVVRFHLGLRLCITAFDSGPLRLTTEELEQGWTKQRDVAISPPIADLLEIPQDQYDEWYLLENSLVFGGNMEVFVNFGGFTLVPAKETATALDTTRNKHGLDWLKQIQERFWAQLLRIQPRTFAASGDYDVVVSRDKRFMAAVREAAR
jgi:hypothetical protein